MLPTRLLACGMLASALAAQQTPFIPVTGPNAPTGAAYLFQDHHGGLWLGGFEGFHGLRYFDGSHFTVPVPDSFRDISVSSIAEDGDGGIWLAALGQGVYRVFHRQMQKVVDSVGVPVITSIAPDVMIATLTPRGKEPQQPIMMRIAKRNGLWSAETLGAGVPGVHAQLDGTGNVIFPCAEGYCEVRVADLIHWQRGTTVPLIRHRMKTSSLGISAIRDRMGCVWIRTYAEAAYQCPADPEAVTLPYSVAGAGGGVLSQLDDGSIVIPSYGRLAIGRPGKFRVLTMANGYPSFGSMLVGKDGCIWLSNANGLFVLPSQLRMEYWTERDGLDGNTWSIVRMEGKVFAISGDNIQILDRDRSRWRLLREFGGATHLMPGTDHTLFASSSMQGVIQISMDGKTVRRSAPANVMMLAQAPDGQIWTTGNEISRLQVSGNRLMLQKVEALAPEGQGKDIKIDRDGNLWNCYAGGLLFGGAGRWRRLTLADGLSSNWCLSLTNDSQGDLWYGSAGVSVIKNPRSLRPVIQNPLRADDSGSAASLFLGADKQGRIWRGTSSGVYVADPAQARRGEWLFLNRADGLPGVDTNQRSFFADEDGSVWFGIDSSVVHLFPSGDLVHPRYAPSVFVSGFSRNGGPFTKADDFGDNRYPADLTAHIGSLQMDRRNAMHFRYRLLPGQTNWTAERRADIPLGRLSWGTHTLEVQASLGSGPWSESDRTSFEVLKPLWLSMPALLGFAVAGTLSLGGVYRLRRSRRMRASTPLPGLAQWRASALSVDGHGFEGVVLDERFEMQSLIARGGFASVWLARDHQQKSRSCAVKVFRRELVDHDWMTKRFRHEVSALERIHHCNVVGIYGHGTVSSGAAYLAMELIEGETLRDLMRLQRLTGAQAASYLRQTGNALAEIHAHGICHRDVKPENLMIRSKARAGAELVLIDFSIAIVQDPDETIHGLSRAAGTLYYMAPEQAIGYATASSDIYSLAKITIEMLTGERLSTLLPNASMDLPARVRELLARIGAGLSQDSIELLASGLEFDPARRPERASEFAVRIAEDLEVGACRPEFRAGIAASERPHEGS